MELLVIEDDPLIGKALRKGLSEAGHTCMWAKEGLRGLELALGQQFDAIVTGASPKGTWVRIAHPAAEGKVVRGDHGLDVGDRVRVTLVDTDFERGFVDFERA